MSNLGGTRSCSCLLTINLWGALPRGNAVAANDYSNQGRVLTMYIASNPTLSAIRAENPSYTPGARIIFPGDWIIFRSLVAASSRDGVMEPILDTTEV